MIVILGECNEPKDHATICYRLIQSGAEKSYLIMIRMSRKF